MNTQYTALLDKLNMLITSQSLGMMNPTLQVPSTRTQQQPAVSMNVPNVTPRVTNVAFQPTTSAPGHQQSPHSHPQISTSNTPRVSSSTNANQQFWDPTMGRAPAGYNIINPYNVSTRSTLHPHQHPTPAPVPAPPQPTRHPYSNHSQVPQAVQQPTVPPAATAAPSSTTTMPIPTQVNTTYGYQPTQNHQPTSTYPTSNHVYNSTAVPQSHSFNPMYHTPYHLANATDKDPTWPEYQEGDPFIDWLEQMQVTASSSCKYQHLIMYNSSNQLELRSHLNQQDNILLYKMLLDGLPTTIATAHASTLRQTCHHHDGTALLARLRQEYDHSKTYTDTGKQNLIDQLRSLKRQKGESF